MKNLFLNHFSTIQFYLLNLILLFPVLPRGVQSTLMIIAGGAVLLFLLLKGKTTWTFKKTSITVFMAIVFFVFLYSILYSNNLHIAQKYVVTTIPLIVFPMLFLVNDDFKLNPQKFRQLCYVYLFALTALLIFLHIKCYHQLYVEGITKFDFRNLIENLIDVHGTYLSIWIGVGILMLIYQTTTLYKWKTLIGFQVLAVMYLAYWMNIIDARLPLFAIMLVLALYFMLYLKIPFKVIILLAIMLSLGAYAFFSNKIENKIEVLKNYEKAIPHGKYSTRWPYISNDNVRSVIYHCSWETITQNKFLGIGIGDVDKNLQDCYDTQFNYTDLFKIKTFNSHSQYLLILLASGIIGLVLCFLAGLNLLINAIKRNNFIYVSFVFYMAFCFLFENILSRHDGVICFSVINALLFFYNFSESHINTTKTKNQ